MHTESSFSRRQPCVKSEGGGRCATSRDMKYGALRRRLKPGDGIASLCGISDGPFGSFRAGKCPRRVQ